MHGMESCTRLVMLQVVFQSLWQPKANYFKGKFKANTFLSKNRNYKIHCAKPEYSRNQPERQEMGLIVIHCEGVNILVKIDKM